MSLVLSRREISEKLALSKSISSLKDRSVFVLPNDVIPIMAAVLIPIVYRKGKLSILLTKRTSHLTHHAGQVSFPGGRVAEGDKNRQMTALRETREEIGLDLSDSDVLGRLPEYDIRTGFRVTPVVAWVDSPVIFSSDPYEVESIFEVPINHVLELSNYTLESLSEDPVNRHFYRLRHDKYNIWGATAGMLRNFVISLSMHSAS